MAIAKDQIVAAAIDLLNEVGIDQLTTRKLATRLGVAQPALYWHFKSKDVLLDAVNAEILARYHVVRRPRAKDDWQTFTLAYARSARTALLSVRDGARINAGTRPTADQFADAEAALELYVAEGFSSEEAFNISLSIARYVVGFVLEEQGERARDAADEPAPDTDPLDEVAPFPLLSAALEPLTREGTINTERAFEAGLGYMVAGIRASLAGRKAHK